jgi:hypothetical protein
MKSSIEHSQASLLILFFLCRKLRPAEVCDDVAAVVNDNRALIGHRDVRVLDA